MGGDEDVMQVRPVTADALTAGQSVVLPAGDAVEVLETWVETDDFGTPAVVVAGLSDGGSLRMAAKSTVYVPLSNDQDVAAPVAADDGSPEALVAHVAAIHPESERLRELADRLGRGVNVKSGSHLHDLHDIAMILFVDLADPANALRTADLLATLPYDGNFGRWKWIESALAMAAFITRDNAERSAWYSTALRVPDDAEPDPLRAKSAAAVRQRQLNDPNLYDPEIVRASAAPDRAAEKEWRVLRLGALLYLRAHGGSQTLSREALERRIANELRTIASLNS